ncbi:hypothetical protein GF314_02450 [bacterium]|nr:hypothetical protein [bacterium]
MEVLLRVRVSGKNRVVSAGVKSGNQVARRGYRSVTPSRKSRFMMSTEFRPGLSTVEVDQALRASVDAYDRARQNAAMWFTEALERGIYREFGHASMEIYAREELGFSTGRTRQFLALSRNLRRMPHLRAAITEGRLGWTKAQEVARVVTPANEREWVEKAIALPREELRRAMAAARMAARQRRRSGATVDTDPPTTIALKLDGLQLARFDAAITAVKKAGIVAPTASRAEVVLAGLAALTENPDVECRHAPAATVIARRCPDCEVVFARGKRLDPTAADALECDHVRRRADGRNRSVIPPSTRGRVLDRDGYRCTTPGCSNSHFLEIHHIVPRHRGGSNRLENLTTLCTRCHRHAHAAP